MFWTSTKKLWVSHYEDKLIEALAWKKEEFQIKEMNSSSAVVEWGRWDMWTGDNCSDLVTFRQSMLLKTTFGNTEVVVLRYGYKDSVCCN